MSSLLSSLRNKIYMQQRVYFSNAPQYNSLLKISPSKAINKHKIVSINCLTDSCFSARKCNLWEIETVLDIHIPGAHMLRLEKVYEYDNKGDKNPYYDKVLKYFNDNT